MMLAGDPRDDRGFAGVARLVGGIEPVPARRGVGGRGLSRIGDQQTIRFGDGVHVCPGREVVGVLLAAMQHDDEAAWSVGRGGGDIEFVGPRAGCAGEGA